MTEPTTYPTWREAMQASLRKNLTEQFGHDTDSGYRWRPVRYLDGRRDMKIFDPALTPKYTWTIERYRK